MENILYIALLYYLTPFYLQITCTSTPHTDSVPLRTWSPCLAQQATCWIQKNHQWHHIKWAWCCSFMS